MDLQAKADTTFTVDHGFGGYLDSSYESRVCSLERRHLGPDWVSYSGRVTPYQLTSCQCLDVVYGYSDAMA
jgi:hypothetical protein